MTRTRKDELLGKKREEKKRKLEDRAGKEQRLMRVKEKLLLVVLD